MRPGGGWPGRVLAVLVAAFFVFATMYTDFLWYDQLSFAQVLTTRWIATALMFVVGFFGMAVPMFIAWKTCAERCVCGSSGTSSAC